MARVRESFALTMARGSSGTLSCAARRRRVRSSPGVHPEPVDRYVFSLGAYACPGALYLPLHLNAGRGASQQKLMGCRRCRCAMQMRAVRDHLPRRLLRPHTAARPRARARPCGIRNGRSTRQGPARSWRGRELGRRAPRKHVMCPRTDMARRLSATPRTRLPDDVIAGGSRPGTGRERARGGGHSARVRARGRGDAGASRRDDKITLTWSRWPARRRAQNSVCSAPPGRPSGESGK